MRTVNLVQLLSLLVILLSGCNPHGNEGTPYQYYFKLKIENHLGENLVKGIKYDQMARFSTLSGESFRVYVDEYVLQTSSVNASVDSELLRVEIDNNQYECLYFLYSSFDHIASTITQKLKCPHIFGDNNEHVIVSYWDKDSKGELSCSKITCDDKEFQVKKENALEHTALITLP